MKSQFFFRISKYFEPDDGRRTLVESGPEHRGDFKQRSVSETVRVAVAVACGRKKNWSKTNLHPNGWVSFP